MTPTNGDAKQVPMPSQSQIDTAREELERATFKVGRARTRAIMSSAQARADTAALQQAEKAAEALHDTYIAMVERFTSNDQIAQATAAIRERLAPEMLKDAPGAQAQVIPAFMTKTKPGPLFGKDGVDKIEVATPVKPWAEFPGGIIASLMPDSMDDQAHIVAVEEHPGEAWKVPNQILSTGRVGEYLAPAATFVAKNTEKNSDLLLENKAE